MSCVFSLCLSDETCKCWEGFTPQNQTFCRAIEKGNRVYTIIPCGLEEPPTCKCQESTGKEVTLPFGELNCVGKTAYERVRCEPEIEWNDWFDKHPEFVLNN